MSIVYLDGEYLAKEEAKVSVEDRGFMLADGVYEVTAVYADVLAVTHPLTRALSRAYLGRIERVRAEARTAKT